MTGKFIAGQKWTEKNQKNPYIEFSSLIKGRNMVAIKNNHQKIKCLQERGVWSVMEA